MKICEMCGIPIEETYTNYINNMALCVDCSAGVEDE